MIQISKLSAINCKITENNVHSKIDDKLENFTKKSKSI